MAAAGGGTYTLLTPEHYASAKRTTFTAFYTSPLVIKAMHAALKRLGVPSDATVLKPGCGIGNFIAHAPQGMKFIGVELDQLSGRIAAALYPYPDHFIRIENFRDARLPENRIDAVIGNVPFADLKLDYWGERLSLHEFFLAKSLDSLKAGGVLALVVTHYMLDRQNPGFRKHIIKQADFLGAIRLPLDAFAQEGTKVVTDILFLRKCVVGEDRNYAHTWLTTAPMPIEGVDIPINLYFHQHPEMVLGAWTRQDRLYGSEVGYSLAGSGDLAEQLQEAVRRLPEGVFGAQASSSAIPTSPPTPLPPLEQHITEGSFFVAQDLTIMQVQNGEAVPVTHGDKPLKADTGLIGRRLHYLIRIRDDARCVLQSQNEGWPQEHRQHVRASLNRVYDGFVEKYGPINTTTIHAKDDGTVIRRMPNLVKFKDDPDAMLVMSLEYYDEATGTAEKAAIMHRDVVGRSPPVTSANSAEEALLVSLDQKGRVDLPYMASLYSGSPRQITDELGDLLYQDLDTQEWLTADEYLSGNVRAKLAAADAAGPAYERNAEALRAVQPEDVLPGDIDANLGAPWIPGSDMQAFAAHLFGVAPSAIQVGHLKKDAVWSVEPSLETVRYVAATTDCGTDRANGVWLLEHALNMRTPTIYDTIMADGKEERVVNQEETLAAREKQKRIKEQFKGWIFTDQDRTERLVRMYNDTYNNIRLRSFIDESAAYKNLESATKMERVAGIQTSGSERAFDMYMKCRSLHLQHPGHGVTFASGTPISNTMVEMYTVQRYLDPDGLAARGIDHFDAWAATFGEVIETMEISPDGKSLRPRSRFAKFVNMPELQQMFRAFADVQTAEMLNLPRPALKGGKPTVVACPMSDEQCTIQESLVARYEAIRAGKVKPWEDNALAITTDGRKLALDARLLSPHADDFAPSKINALVENVCEIWQDCADTKGAQLVFCDMGVNPTKWGYSVYQDITDKLVKEGIPREHIASIGEADTDTKKQVLFEKVRAGAIRVLLGSTQKMGTGTNVQKRLVALHHLDAPWKPAEVE